MNTDDLPPPEHDPPNGSDFWSELGGTFAGLVLIGLFLAVAGLALYALAHWLR
jgi:hypothetical protein